MADFKADYHEFYCEIIYRMLAEKAVLFRQADDVISNVEGNLTVYREAMTLLRNAVRNYIAELRQFIAEYDDFSTENKPSAEGTKINLKAEFNNNAVFGLFNVIRGYFLRIDYIIDADNSNQLEVFKKINDIFDRQVCEIIKGGSI